MNQSSLFGLPRAAATKTRDVKKVPFVELLDGRLQGVVSSGSDIRRVYVSYFEVGTLNFGCSTNNNRPCGGLRGRPCNHLRELMHEAVIEFGIAHVVQFLRPVGDPAQFIDANVLANHAGHINHQFAGDIFSRFLGDLELLELPVYNTPLTSMTWFAE
jgi:hypothetical protein